MGAALAKCLDHGSAAAENDDDAFTPNPSNPTATFTVSGGMSGSFTAEIFLDRVPLTASNFIDLAQSGFYDGLHFHRVLPNFMVQFGCPLSADPTNAEAGTGGPQDGSTFLNLATGREVCRINGGNIRDEFTSEDSNDAGTLSMANTGAPNTGGSQFFLNVNDNYPLDWFSEGTSQHPVFGHVTKGYDLMVAISQVPTASENPIEPIKMDSVVISNLP
jgi:cyclophilin family peptidyl-prolyl cis-trans isomerase